MESDENLHRLEGTSNEKGGLIIKKKPSVFKVPQQSRLGLDRLAAQKRKEKEEAARKMSFNIDEEENNEVSDVLLREKREKDSRKFRSPQEETPTYTGGITREARERFIERLSSNKIKEKGVYATTKNKQDRESEKDREHHRKRRKTKDVDRNRSKEKYKRSERSERNSERKDRTPRFKDEPKTPDIRIKDSTSKSSWDEEDEAAPAKKSTWDFPTPSVYRSKGTEWSERSNRSHDRSDRSRRDNSSRDKRYKIEEEDTPRPTPAHKYNAWMKDRKRTGATPGVGKDESLKWDATVDRENWEEEQKRLDREWYNMDEGYDDEHNPFSSVSDEYTKKKEEQLEQRKKKRLSAQQRQINKDNELWERNRMLTSGMY